LVELDLDFSYGLAYGFPFLPLAPNYESRVYINKKLSYRRETARQLRIYT